MLCSASVALLKPAWGDVVQHGGKLDDEQRQRSLELTSVRYSLENLRTFPFVSEREEKGKLNLHGGHFDIASGTLSILNHSRGEFLPL